MAITCKKALNVSLNFALYIVAIDGGNGLNVDLGAVFHQKFSL